MFKGVLVKSLVVAYAFAGFALAATPAAALDDGNSSILDVFDFVGLGNKKDEEAIHYRERPPLVLPPKTGLRQPVPPASQRAADWPKDQEAVRAAQRGRDNRFREAEEANADTGYAGKLTQIGRINQANSPNRGSAPRDCDMSPGGANPCDPTTLWKNLAVKNDSPATRAGLEAGVEPDRQYLTQPPKGYMAPKRNVAAKIEPRRPNEDTIFDYFRKKETTE